MALRLDSYIFTQLMHLNLWHHVQNDTYFFSDFFYIFKFSVDVIQGGKFTKNRAVSLVNDLKQVDRACGMLQEKLGFVLEYVEDVLVSIFTFNLLLCLCHHNGWGIKCYLPLSVSTFVTPTTSAL